MSSDGKDRQGHCYPGSHPCFCGEDFPSELVWEEGWIDIKVYTFLDDVTRICCNINWVLETICVVHTEASNNLRLASYIVAVKVTS